MKIVMLKRMTTNLIYSNLSNFEIYFKRYLQEIENKPEKIQVEYLSYFLHKVAEKDFNFFITKFFITKSTYLGNSILAKTVANILHKSRSFRKLCLDSLNNKTDFDQELTRLNIRKYKDKIQNHIFKNLTDFEKKKYGQEILIYFSHKNASSRLNHFLEEIKYSFAAIEIINIGKKIVKYNIPVGNIILDFAIKIVWDEIKVKQIILTFEEVKEKLQEPIYSENRQKHYNLIKQMINVHTFNKKRLSIRIVNYFKNNSTKSWQLLHLIKVMTPKFSSPFYHIVDEIVQKALKMENNTLLRLEIIDYHTSITNNKKMALNFFKMAYFDCELNYINALALGSSIHKLKDFKWSYQLLQQSFKKSITSKEKIAVAKLAIRYCFDKTFTLKVLNSSISSAKTFSDYYDSGILIYKFNKELSFENLQKAFYLAKTVNEHILIAESMVNFDDELARRYYKEALALFPNDFLDIVNSIYKTLDEKKWCKKILTENYIDVEGLKNKIYLCCTIKNIYPELLDAAVDEILSDKYITLDDYIYFTCFIIDFGYISKEELCFEKIKELPVEEQGHQFVKYIIYLDIMKTWCYEKKAFEKLLEVGAEMEDYFKLLNLFSPIYSEFYSTTEGIILKKIKLLKR